MPRDRMAIGSCEACHAGSVNCSHNRFVDTAETIDTWEHRCTDCGERRTQAVRAAMDAVLATPDPLICPFCGRRAG